MTYLSISFLKDTTDVYNKKVHINILVCGSTLRYFPKSIILSAVEANENKLQSVFYKADDKCQAGSHQ